MSAKGEQAQPVPISVRIAASYLVSFILIVGLPPQHASALPAKTQLDGLRRVLDG